MEKKILSQTDRLCLVALAGCFLAPHLAVWAMDAAAIRAAERVDKPMAEFVWEAPVNQPQLLEAMVIQLEQELCRADVPLDRELQAVLREACEEHSVPIHLALGLIEVESRFDSDADNGLCYGLMQLNRRYYPDGLAPAENIRAGVAHLGKLLERYGDTAVALTAYNAGHDTGSRSYANAVLAAAEHWKEN